MLKQWIHPVYHTCSTANVQEACFEFSENFLRVLEYLHQNIHQNLLERGFGMVLFHSKVELMENYSIQICERQNLRGFLNICSQPILSKNKVNFETIYLSHLPNRNFQLFHTKIAFEIVLAFYNNYSSKNLYPVDD